MENTPQTDIPEAKPIASTNLEKVHHINALVIYSQDADDDYPFPDEELRRKLFDRISEYFRVMSYGKHQLNFKEITNDGGFFKTKDSAPAYSEKFYSNNYAWKGYDGPFGIYNEEVLTRCLEKNGVSIFQDIDLIIMVATDGGGGWYMPSVNAQGYARLGFNFTVGSRVFDAKWGGITVEIGSDYIDKLYTNAELYWTFAHEYCHWLGYRNHRPKNVGIYSLMAQQLYANEKMIQYDMGPNPIDPLLAIQFGWLDEQDDARVLKIYPYEKEVQVTLKPIRSREGLVLVKIPLPGTEQSGALTEYTEYFYLAYHKQNQNPFDDIYDNSGLLIWHSVADSYIDLECAQSLQDDPNKDHLDVGLDMSGLPIDFFNGDNGFEFTPSTNPNSNIWGILNASLKNKASGVSVMDIKETNESISFKVIFN